MARLIDAVQGHGQVKAQLLKLVRSTHMPHALVFSGPAGIGKKMAAWATAQMLLCERDSAELPCGECPSCRRVEKQQSESVLLLEPHNNLIKLESAHQVLEFLSLRQLAKARVVIVDGAHQLNQQAANALLKVVEEPPPHVHFILIVPEISQLLATLRSRCQVIRFSPLPESLLATLEPDSQAWMRRSARGSVERLQAFSDEDMENYRQLAIDVLQSGVLDRHDILEGAVSRIKDRESATYVLHFLQELLRDWTLQGHAPLLHQDLEIKGLPEVPVDARLQLWRMAHGLELDLNAHVDRNLLFENFFYQARVIG
jgi:DNA polymerase-3 subunit delta'